MRPRAPKAGHGRGRRAARSPRRLPFRRNAIAPLGCGRCCGRSTSAAHVGGVLRARDNSGRVAAIFREGLHAREVATEIRLPSRELARCSQASSQRDAPVEASCRWAPGRRRRRRAIPWRRTHRGRSAMIEKACRRRRAPPITWPSGETSTSGCGVADQPRDMAHDQHGRPAPPQRRLAAGTATTSPPVPSSSGPTPNAAIRPTAPGKARDRTAPPRSSSRCPRPSATRAGRQSRTAAATERSRPAGITQIDTIGMASRLASTP